MEKVFMISESQTQDTASTECKKKFAIHTADHKQI